GLHRRPRTVCVPRVRTSLKGARLPDWLLAFAMQVVTEKWRLDLLAKLARRLMSAKRHSAEVLALCPAPASLKPRPRNHEICVGRIVLCRVAEDLPRAPRIFLVPKAGDVQIGDR